MLDILLEFALTAAGTVLLLVFIFVWAGAVAGEVHIVSLFAYRVGGTIGALSIYCAELMIWDHYVVAQLRAINAGFDSHSYDGPVGFGAGMLGGFLMFLTAALLVMNIYGLWSLYRRVAAR